MAAVALPIFERPRTPSNTTTATSNATFQQLEQQQQQQPLPFTLPPAQPEPALRRVSTGPVPRLVDLHHHALASANTSKSQGNSPVLPTFSTIPLQLQLDSDTEQDCQGETPAQATATKWRRSIAAQEAQRAIQQLSSLAPTSSPPEDTTSHDVIPETASTASLTESSPPSSPQQHPDATTNSHVSAAPPPVDESPRSSTRPLSNTFAVSHPGLSRRSTARASPAQEQSPVFDFGSFAEQLDRLAFGEAAAFPPAARGPSTTSSSSSTRAGGQNTSTTLLPSLDDIFSSPFPSTSASAETPWSKSSLATLIASSSSSSSPPAYLPAFTNDFVSLEDEDQHSFPFLPPATLSSSPPGISGPLHTVTPRESMDLIDFNSPLVSSVRRTAAFPSPGSHSLSHSTSSSPVKGDQNLIPPSAVTPTRKSATSTRAEFEIRDSPERGMDEDSVRISVQRVAKALGTGTSPIGGVDASQIEFAGDGSFDFANVTSEDVEEDAILLDDEDEDEFEGEEEEEESEEEEEEDPDTHPIYTLLSTSNIPSLRTTWDAATLILVPPRRTIPSLAALTANSTASISNSAASGSVSSPTRAAGGISPSSQSGFEFVRGGKGISGQVAGRDAEKDRKEQATYVGLHAFRPEAKDNERWTSVGTHKDGQHVRVRLEPARGLVHVEWVVPPPSPTSNASSIPPSSSTTSISSIGSANSMTTKLVPQLSPSMSISTSKSIPFPSVKPRLSSESEESEILPPTPPLPPTVVPATQPCSPVLMNPPEVMERKSSSSLLAPPVPSNATSATSSRPLQIVSETTIYRRPRSSLTSSPSSNSTNAPNSSSTTSPSSSSTQSLHAKPSKPAFRAPKWFRRTPSVPVPTPTASKVKEPTPMLERVRVIAVDGQIVLDWADGALPRPTSSRRSTHSNVPGGAGGPGAAIAGRSIGGSRSQLSLLQRNRSFDPPVQERTRSHRAGSVASTRSARSAAAWSVSGAAVGLSARRDFLLDLAVLVFPPSQLAVLTEPFAAVLDLVWLLVKDFKLSFAYVKGFDAYTVQRIRKGILEKAWAQLVLGLNMTDLGASIVGDDQANLPQLLENVVMGLLHSKLYTGSIVPQFAAENSAINHIISLYHTRNLTPADLGVDVCEFGEGAPLAKAVAAMAHLTKAGGPPPTPELMAALEVYRDGCSVEMFGEELREAKTPLGCIAIMRLAIEEIVEAVEAQGARAVPDDLIPLVAWVVIQAQVEDMESLLYYVKTFRLGDNLAAEFDWSFVTFQATLALLLSDPLGALADSPLPAPPSNAVPISASPSTRRASELPSFRPRWSSMYGPFVPPPVNSPPGSPHSVRTTGSLRSTTSHSQVLSRSTTGAATSTLEHRMSWHVSRDKRLSLNLDGTEIHEVPKPPSEKGEEEEKRPERPERTASEEEMPPPTWTTTTTKHQRRQSLGVLPSSSARFPSDSSSIHSHWSIPERRSTASPQNSDDGHHHVRHSSSTSTELQIRPRIVLSRQHTKSMHHHTRQQPWQPTLEPTGPRSLGRSHSSRQIGPALNTSLPPSFGVPPVISSADMRRSESEGSPSSPNIPRAYSETWGLWSSVRSDHSGSERAESPTPASASGSDSWWPSSWATSAMSLSATRSLHSGTPPPAVISTATAASGQLEEAIVRRARRHSASAADLLGGRTLSLPFPSSASGLGSKLHQTYTSNSALSSSTSSLAAESAGPSGGRPRSIMSVSSFSSQDTTMDSFGLSHSQHHMSSSIHSLGGSHPVSSRRRRRQTQSLMRLDSAAASVRPLAPQVDHQSVVAFADGTTTTATIPSDSAGSDF
ncbi:hypothetical protein T439DRAFT_378571 [Meredithblackwellia eburnea MCA 4105]